MKKLLILSGLLCGLNVGAQAEPSRPANASAAGSNAALEAALQSCVAQVKRDSSGRLDRTAFDACMSTKGFEKPSGPPPGGKGGRGAPPQ